MTGAAAVAAVQDGLMQLRTSADLRLTVRKMHVRRFNGGSARCATGSGLC